MLLQYIYNYTILNLIINDTDTEMLANKMLLAVHILIKA